MIKYMVSHSVFLLSRVKSSWADEVEEVEGKKTLAYYRV